MKIICDSCGTKYSIADEKVKGKVFKIRCKKCQHIIVVRGTSEEAGGDEPAAMEQPAAASAAAVASSGGGTPIWHVVIGGEQVGPMTDQEVRDRFASGEVNADTYTWREGFTDWVRLATVDEFTDLEGGGAAAAAPAAAAAGWDAAPAAEGWGGAGGAGNEDPGWGGQDSAGFSADAAPGFSADDAPGFSANDAPGFSADAAPGFSADAAPGFSADAAPGFSADAAPAAGTGDAAPAGAFGDGGGTDLFGEQPTATADPAAAAAFSAPATEEAGGSDLFGGAGSGQQLFPEDDSAKEGDDVQMTGQRGENSVLFSLSNLQHLAMGSKGAAPAAAPSASPSAAGPSPSPSPSNGSSAEVGSGLIDIRTMAASTAAATSTAKAEGGEDLPVLGGFSAPVAAPVLMPAASEERPKWMLPAIFGGGGLMLVGLIVVIVLLATKDPVVAPPPVVASNTHTNPMAKQDPAADTAKATENAAKADEKQPAKEDETKANETEKKADKRSSRRKSSRRRGSARKRSEPKAAAPSRTPSRSSRSNKPKRKKDSLDDLIDGALGGGKKKARSRSSRSAAPAADSNLPETLGRSQIQGGMRRIKGRVQGCYDKFKVPGLANVQVKIGRSGKVSSSRIKGIFSGTPTGACVLSAVRSARFPKFKGSPITITYPFVLR